MSMETTISMLMTTKATKLQSSDVTLINQNEPCLQGLTVTRNRERPSRETRWDRNQTGPTSNPIFVLRPRNWARTFARPATAGGARETSECDKRSHRWEHL